MPSSTNIITTNLGIIHLSDIHFSIGKSFDHQKMELLFRALKDDFSGCHFVYIVVSGDIVNTGKLSEYEVALPIFTDYLLKWIEYRYSSSQFKFIFVPGNHDCNFDLDTQVRRNTIKNINKMNCVKPKTLTVLILKLYVLLAMFFTIKCI